MVKVCRRSALVLALALGAVASATRGQEAAPVDPAHVVTSLRRAYHKRPIVESVEVEARTPSERRRESYVFRGNTRGEVRLELGDLLIWTDGPRLLAVHRLNAGVYFEAELEGDDRAAAVRAVLPPLPVPQLDLALQRIEAGSAAWNPGLACGGGSGWTDAETITLGGKPGNALRSSDPECRRSAVCLGQPPRLLAVQSSVSKDGVETTVRATVTKLDEAVGRLDADLRGRERAASLGELRAEAGDVRRGVAMPEFVVEPLKRDGAKPGALVPAGKPVLIVIAAGMDDAAERTARSLRAAAGSAKVEFRLIAAAPIVDTPERRALFDAARRVDDRGAWVSYSPQTTLRRLTSSSPAAMALVDSSGLVLAVEPLNAEGAEARVREGIGSLKP